MEDAEELKKEGTEHFRAQEWEQSLSKYKSALNRLPKRPPSSSPLEKERKADIGHNEEKSNEVSNSETETTKEPESEEVVQPLAGLQLECAKARAVLNANIGACHVKLVINGYIVLNAKISS